MPIRKFHSVEDMPPLLERRPFDPENLLIAIAWSRATLALCPEKRIPGVRKFRSYEAMKASHAVADAQSTDTASTETASFGSEDSR